MKSLNLIIVFLALFIFTSCSSDGEKNTIEQINVTEAQARAEKGVLFVDVRSEMEIKELAYDVKNIVHIPLGTLEDNLDKVAEDKEVILVCRSGGRSNKAATILLKNGYSKVANMEGGIMAWSKEGFPTHKGE
jgi:rhodanese-related sulfurtransferase